MPERHRRPTAPEQRHTTEVRKMLVVAIAAMLADCDTIAEIAEWGQEHEPWLRRFLVLRNGVASAHTFERLFRMLDPKHFEHVFRRWVGDLVPRVEWHSRHRRQVRTRIGQRREPAAAHDQRLRHRTGSGTRAGEGGRQEQRDHRNPGAARSARPARAAGEHRRDGMPEDDSRSHPRAWSGLPARGQSQPAFAERGDRDRLHPCA